MRAAVCVKVHLAVKLNLKQKLMDEHMYCGGKLYHKLHAIECKSGELYKKYLLCAVHTMPFLEPVELYEAKLGHELHETDQGLKVKNARIIMINSIIANSSAKSVLFPSLPM